MRKTFEALTIFFIICNFLLNSALAQKKNLSYEQLFKSSPTNIIKPLPIIVGWADDEHYLELRKDSTAGNETIKAVSIKTGKEIPYKKDGPKVFPSIAALGLRNNEKNITFSPDGKWAAYTRANNLYAMEMATKIEAQVTRDGSDSILNGYASWIYYEEILGRSSRYKAFWWSPDSKHLAFMRFDDSKVPMFPIYISEGQHGYLENQRYPKPGDKNPEVKIGLVSVEKTGATIWSDFNSKEDQYFGPPIWTPGGQFWVQWLNREQNLLKIYAIDLTNGQKKEIYAENQSTWIDLDETNRIEFLPSGKGFILKSDKDGWENLYLHNVTGKQINPITAGNFWGTGIVKIDEKNNLIYFRARKENSTRFDFYKARLDGRGVTRLTFGDFSHEQIFLSPNGKYFITSYSNASTPSAMVLMDSKGKMVRELGSGRGAEFENYNLPKTDIIRVKSGDSLFDLPMAITYPVNFDPDKKYPVLINIYGGPNAGIVFDRWKPVGGASQWWAQEGMIQVTIDSRSSGHFGKKGLNFIYRQLGKWEIEDYMSCGKWLRAQKWVDTMKVAITGGSFGGYLTCMALTYGSEIFTHGIANAPVTDWQLYDTHYTERFMDTPGENVEGYKNTSVMNYAGRYKGLLRIVHGSSDDNVHMQNSVQLIDALQKMNKHFEFMLYPAERHAIGANDPAKAMHNRLEAYRFYYKYLLNKPMPAVFFGNTVQMAF